MHWAYTGIIEVESNVKNKENGTDGAFLRVPLWSFCGRELVSCRFPKGLVSIADYTISDFCAQRRFTYHKEKVSSPPPPPRRFCPYEDPMQQLFSRVPDFRGPFVFRQLSRSRD